jgi:hypothetical protein
MYLKDFVEVFEEHPALSLSSTCYCHNYPMSDAVKGCYVCFLDKPTENYFRSRLAEPWLPTPSRVSCSREHQLMAVPASSEIDLSAFIFDDP